MPGSHSKKDKLKKKVRKAGLGKKDYEEERKEYEKSIHRKPHKRDLKHSPPVRESNPRTPLKKEVPFGIKNDLGKESKDTTEKMRQMIRHNVKGKKINNSIIEVMPINDSGFELDFIKALQHA